MSIEAMKQALEYIKATNKSSSFWRVPASELNKTVKALRTAITEAEKQEPVACPDCFGSEFPGTIRGGWRCKTCDGTAYVDAPAEQRQWVGLTAAEVDRCWNMTPMDTRNSRHMFAYSIEAKLKEKNT